jgi:hypothetical protein
VGAEAGHGLVRLHLRRASLLFVFFTALHFVRRQLLLRAHAQLHSRHRRSRSSTKGPAGSDV